MSDQPLKLLIVLGWRASGKSTVVEALLRKNPKLRVVRDDGVADLSEVLDSHTDVESDIVIEADASVEPMSIAEIFYLESPEGIPPDTRFEIRSVITVVDASRFFSELNVPEPIPDVEDDITSADVIVEQIEFADVIVLNRLSEMEPAERLRVQSAIEWLNPRAYVVEHVAGTPLDVLRASEFDLSTAAEEAGWVQILAGSHPKLNRGVGLEGLAIRARRPVHPERFLEFLKKMESENILRINGWLWVATRNGEIGLWQRAGRSSVLVSGGAWMAATPMREWPEDPMEREEIMSDWIAPHGDRRQELSIIGFNINELEIRRAFKHCLLTDDEFEKGAELWATWTDPLPDWSVGDGSDFDGYLN